MSVIILSFAQSPPPIMFPALAVHNLRLLNDKACDFVTISVQALDALYGSLPPKGSDSINLSPCSSFS